MTRLRRVLCPATPDAYFNWIPASLHCSSFPPKAEMMNSSGENDVCLLVHHSASGGDDGNREIVWLCRTLNAVTRSVTHSFGGNDKQERRE